MGSGRPTPHDFFAKPEQDRMPAAIVRQHAFTSMGTTVALSLDLPPASAASIATGLGVAVVEAPRSASAVDLIERIFAHLDGRFSLFRPESELSRLAGGSLDLETSSEELRDLYGQSLAWRQRTHGAFTPHRPDGVIDLNGIVKAEAMRRSGEALEACGLVSWRLSVGADVLASGNDADGWPWTVTINDPAGRSTPGPPVPLGTLELRGTRRAVATAGGRDGGDGPHTIWPGGSAVAAAARGDFAQVTVAANDIITADVLATAIAAGGIASLHQLTHRWPIDVLAIDHNGGRTATPGMRAALLQA